MIDAGFSLKSPDADLPHLARLTALGELIASLAHELNQPFAAIATNGEASLNWLDRPMPAIEEVRVNLTAIIDSAQRAGQLVHRLRNFSKKAAIENVELALNEVVHEVLPLIKGEAQRHEVSLTLDLATPSPRVWADRIQLQQVVLNLLMNGLQATASVDDRRRKLVITSRRHLDHGAVAVHDNGSGFDPQTVERMFDPFFTTRPDGLGIGLSLCRSIIEAHGGRIEAVRNKKHGSTFAFALPVIPRG
jgi:C4-dicarboxylate-specific signal transduction histidine kinase